VASSFERTDLGDVQWMRDEDVEDSEAEDDTAQCLCDAGNSGDIVLSDEHVSTAMVLAQHVVYGTCWFYGVVELYMVRVGSMEWLSCIWYVLVLWGGELYTVCVGSTGWLSCV